MGGVCDEQNRRSNSATTTTLFVRARAMSLAVARQMGRSCIRPARRWPAPCRPRRRRPHLGQVQALHDAVDPDALALGFEVQSVGPALHC